MSDFFYFFGRWLADGFFDFVPHYFYYAGNGNEQEPPWPPVITLYNHQYGIGGAVRMQFAIYDVCLLLHL